MAVPIKDFPLFISLFESLVNDFTANPERRYRYTWDSYPVKLQPRSPEKIVEILEPGRYRVLIKNLSNQTIPLYLGDAEPDSLVSQVSAWQVDPLGLRIDITECTIWALPPADCDIIVTIHSEVPNLNKEETKMPIPLIVVPDVPTGKNFYLADWWENWYEENGYDFLEEKGDSQLRIDGFKAFSLGAFEPGTSYELSVNIDPGFSTIDSSSGECIQLHLVTSNLLDLLKLALFSGWVNNYLGFLPEGNPPGLKTWVSGGRMNGSKLEFRNSASKDEERRLISTEKLVIKPNLLTRYYFFRVKLDINEWKSAVFNYDHVNQTVNILGY